MKLFTTLISLTAVFSLCAEKTADHLRSSALNGDLYAMIRLGDEFFRGKNRPRNPDLAAFWYRKAALKKLPLGLYKFGVCHEFGIGVKKDIRQAYEYYQAAGNLGSAQLRLADMLLSGVHANSTLGAIPPDKVRALKIMRKLCRANYYPALLKLAKTLYADPLWRKNHASEIYSLTLRSSNASPTPPEVMVFHAELLQHGIGVKPDHVYARALLELAARAGDPEGMYRFATILEAGIGTSPDPAKSFSYFQKAAASNHPGAITRLGEFHLSGNFLEHDPGMAVKYFQKAAEQKFPPALRKLAWCCENGIGTAKDPVKAFSYYEQSASLGDAEGTYRTGLCFLNGSGVKSDAVAAVYYFRRGAALGSREAMLAFAECLKQGKGCTKDELMADRIKAAAEKL
ncbi:MAG: SEL1-like repeat protein [Lentisphaeria bacterium]|nr:SEL1-like repeat protein [Lentisphaeria bacterium]